VKISLVIGSRNRATRLAATLDKLDFADLQRNAVEVNLIDSASTDSTYEVMREYRRKCGSPVNIGQADRPGTGLARNVGIKISSGDVIVVTDDDCYIDANYFSKLSMLWDERSFQYGGGQILIFDPTADPRIANLTIEQRYGIPANTVLPAGYIQGANMFFAREVFQRAGLFNEDMPGGSDIEMATRASLQGFRGVLLPELKVLHDHGRKRGSTEAERKVERYDFERGAYYASLIMMGNRQAWALWAQTTPGHDAARLAREMAGAQHYLELMIKKEKSGLH
jgi:glycosyltransferase involved in cell wall biosynthesis